MERNGIFLEKNPRKQPEPLFVLNGDKEPELEDVAETFIELDSHTILTENDEHEVECLPDGDKQVGSSVPIFQEKLQNKDVVIEMNDVATKVSEALNSSHVISQVAPDVQFLSHKFTHHNKASSHKHSFAKGTLSLFMY